MTTPSRLTNIRSQLAEEALAWLDAQASALDATPWTWPHRARPILTSEVFVDPDVLLPYSRSSGGVSIGGSPRDHWKRSPSLIDFGSGGRLWRISVGQQQPPKGLGDYGVELCEFGSFSEQRETLRAVLALQTVAFSARDRRVRQTLSALARVEILSGNSNRGNRLLAHASRLC